MKRMKRIMAAFMMAVFLIACNTGAFAAGTGSVSISCEKENVNVGDTVTVTVNLTLASGEEYSKMDIELSYDADKLKFDSCNKVSTTYGTATLNQTNGKITLSLPEDNSSSNYITSGGDMFEVKFTVKSIDTSGITLKALANDIHKTGNSSIGDFSNGEQKLTCAHSITHTETVNATCKAT